jgi:osmoprotectant transport system substrate-binding protein
VRRVVVTLLAVVVLTTTTVACRGARDVPPVTIGVGSTDEQRVLAALADEALRRAGIPTSIRTELGSTLGLRREALADQIDLYWDYTGAAWALGLREAAPPADPLESWERVREADASRGLVWLPATRANATLALMVRRADLPPPDGQRDLGWLAGELSSGQRSLCADPDFITRDGGLRALAAEYGIDVAGLQGRATAVAEAGAIEAVRAGECFAGLATATSGPARAAGLVPVADELRVFPAFVVAPVVREGSPADRPEVRSALAPVADALDTATLARLNERVATGQDPAAVAADFADRVERVSPTPRPRARSQGRSAA